MRISASIVISALVTFGLFYIMHLLIALTHNPLDDSVNTRVIDFVRLKRDTEIADKKREKPEKRPPPEPPPPPDINTATVKPTTDAAGASFGFDSDVGVDGIGGGLSMTDGDAVPLVRVPAEYPMRAEQRGLEGWVTVEFTISATGSVKDPRVVDSTSSIFHRAALNAIRKWKYNPKVVDGKPVEQPGIQVTLDFSFGDA